MPRIRLETALPTVICLVLALLLQPWGHPIQLDASVYALVGEAWVRGGQLPYVDAFVAKPPVWLLLSGLSASGASLIGLDPATGMRLLSALSATALGVGVAMLLRRYDVRPLLRLLAAATTTLVFVAPIMSDGGGLSEPTGFALVLGAWVVVCYSQRRMAMLVAGVLLAAGAGSSLLTAPFALGCLLSMIGTPDALRTKIIRATWLIVGCAIVTAPILAYFLANHAFGAMWSAVIDYNRAYAAVSCPIAGSTGWPCYPEWDKTATFVMMAAIVVPLLLPMAGLLFARSRRQIPAILVVVAVAAIAVAFPTIRRSPGGHYFWPILLGCLPLMWYGVELTVRRLPERPPRFALGMFVVTVAVAIAVGGLASIASWRASAIGVLPDGVKAVAAASTQYDASRPLYIWGQSTPLYFETHRKLPGRFVHAYPMMLPGFTSADLVRSACEIMAKERPIIASDGMAPELGVQEVTPRGLDPVWFAPMRAMISEHWQLAAESGVARLYVPRSAESLPASICR